jgi:hypothetical protein
VILPHVDVVSVHQRRDFHLRLRNAIGQPDCASD